LTLRKQRIRTLYLAKLMPAIVSFGLFALLDVRLPEW